MLNVWTTQMSGWRKAKELDIALIDITAKSGLQSFAPLFENVMLYKRGLLNEDQYTFLYVERMRESLRTDEQPWLTLLQNKKQVFACYCKSGTFCHRLIFADLFTKYAASKQLIVLNHGEL